MHGRHGQQHGPLGVLVDRQLGLAGQVAGPGLVGLAVGRGALGQREDAEQAGRRRGPTASTPTSGAPAARAGGRFAVGLGAAGGEEAALVVGERHVGVRRPRLGQVEAAAGVQEAGVGPASIQSAVAACEPPACQQVVAGVVDPAPQARPVLEQCLVGDLDGRRAARRVAVEGEQPVPAELAEQRVELVGAEALLLQLAAPDAPAGVVVVLVDVDEGEEHVAHVVALVGCRARRRAPRPAGRSPR